MKWLSGFIFRRDSNCVDLIPTVTAIMTLRTRMCGLSWHLCWNEQQNEINSRSA